MALQDLFSELKANLLKRKQEAEKVLKSQADVASSKRLQEASRSLKASGIKGGIAEALKSKIYQETQKPFLGQQQNLEQQYQTQLGSIEQQEAQAKAQEEMSRQAFWLDLLGKGAKSLGYLLAPKIEEFLLDQEPDKVPIEELEEGVGAKPLMPGEEEMRGTNPKFVFSNIFKNLEKDFVKDKGMPYTEWDDNVFNKFLFYLNPYAEDLLGKDESFYKSYMPEAMFNLFKQKGWLNNLIKKSK